MATKTMAGGGREVQARLEALYRHFLEMRVTGTFKQYREARADLMAAIEETGEYPASIWMTPPSRNN